MDINIVFGVGVISGILLTGMSYCFGSFIGSLLYYI